MISLQMLLRAASKGADENLKRDGFVRPMWLAVDKDDRFAPIPPPVDFLDDAHKDLCAVLVRAMLQILGAKRIVFLGESWFLVGEPAEKFAAADPATRGRVEKWPGAIEVVHFEAEDQSGEYVAAHRAIHRRGRRAWLGELEEHPFTQSEGRLVGWLPRPAGASTH